MTKCPRAALADVAAELRRLGAASWRRALRRGVERLEEQVDVTSYHWAEH